MIPGISDWELLTIEKPSRYLGGEWNQPPDKPQAEVRVCLAFPDIYELGMSNFGLKILYERLNSLPWAQAERVFSPWVDFEDLLRRKNVPLYALESRRSVRDFDLFGITLPYEMTFTNVLNLLELSRIPVLARERLDGPIVVAGGPSAANPMPMADFFDVFFIGDGEDGLLELAQTVREEKLAGTPRSEVLKKMARIEGCWVPEFAGPVRRRVFREFGVTPPPLKPLVSNLESVHDRVPLEVFRGCIQGCRFCNAGFYYRPKRERKAEDLCRWGREMLQNTGDEVLGLISLSTSDYSGLGDLIDRLSQDRVYPEQSLSVPSLRMTDQTMGLLGRLEEMQKSGLTFAPEAGSQRLRDIIGKNITESDILRVIAATRDSHYRGIKLYFMIGLPFETTADLDAIPELVVKIEDLLRREKLRKELSISLSGFIPKPFTPFQWAPQVPPMELADRRRRVCDGLKRSRAKISWRDEALCKLEVVLARGDHRVGALLLAARRHGARFDSWHEHFSPEAWEAAFKETGLTPEEFTRSFPISEKLPWDFVDLRTPRAYFEAEYRRAAVLAGEDPERL